MPTPSLQGAVGVRGRTGIQNCAQADPYGVRIGPRRTGLRAVKGFEIAQGGIREWCLVSCLGEKTRRKEGALVVGAEEESGGEGASGSGRECVYRKGQGEHLSRRR